MDDPMRMKPGSLLGALQQEDTEAPLAGATWYVADGAGDGLCFRFRPGTLEGKRCLTADLLLDGENYNIGFVDACHRPYEPLVEAARASHERLYRLACGEIEPLNDAPEYLPKLFL